MNVSFPCATLYKYFTSIWPVAVPESFETFDKIKQTKGKLSSRGYCLLTQPICISSTDMSQKALFKERGCVARKAC